MSFIQNELARFFNGAKTNTDTECLSRADIAKALKIDASFHNTLSLVNLTSDFFLNFFCGVNTNESHADGDIGMNDFWRKMEALAVPVRLELDSLTSILNRRRLCVPMLEGMAREASATFQRAIMQTCSSEQDVREKQVCLFRIPSDKLCNHILEDRAFTEVIHSAGISIFTISNLLSTDAKRYQQEGKPILIGHIDFVAPFEHALAHAKSKLHDRDATVTQECMADIAKDNDPTEWYHVGIAALEVLGGHLGTLRPGLQVLDSDGEAVLYLSKLAEGDERLASSLPKLPRKFKCIDPNGVAYRNTKTMKDRFEPGGCFARLHSIQEGVGEESDDFGFR